MEGTPILVHILQFTYSPFMYSCPCITVEAWLWEFLSLVEYSLILYPQPGEVDRRWYCTCSYHCKLGSSPLMSVVEQVGNHDRTHSSSHCLFRLTEVILLTRSVKCLHFFILFHVCHLWLWASQSSKAQSMVFKICMATNVVSYCVCSDVLFEWVLHSNTRNIRCSVLSNIIAWLFLSSVP